jgi:hypothetical protein
LKKARKEGISCLEIRDKGMRTRIHRENTFIP